MRIFFLIFAIAQLFALYAAASPLPESYEVSRKAFGEAAELLNRAAGGVLYKEILVPSRVDSDLSIGTLYMPAKSKKKNLVVISSGIHGVEAPAGSEILLSLVESCLPSIKRDETGILLIHNMNPYGFKYGRRFNENNVDLNRNCFNYKKPFPGASYPNEAYAKLRPVFENLGFFSSEFALKASIAFHGVITESYVASALSGQYFSPKGIYYGGDKTEFECEKAQELLGSIGQQYSSALHLDVHTGLGKFGINQIMTNEDISEEDFRRFESLFPEKQGDIYSVERSTGQNGTLITHGDFTRSLCEMAPNLKPCIAATAEIGARGGTATLRAIINENVTFQNETEFKSKRATSIKELREVFAPNDPKWIQQVIKNNEVMCNAIKRFISKE